MSAQPTCLVLGGHGFVGSALVAEATRRGFKTIVAGREEYPAVKGTSCDVLINANGNSRKYWARQYPVSDFEHSVLSVMRSLHDFHYNRYVLLSSVDVYTHVSDPSANKETAPIEVERLSRYGLHKAMAEELVRHYARRRLILRMGGLVGPGLWKNPIYDLLTGAGLRVHPDSEYQYLNTADCARMIFELMERAADQDCFNVAGDGVMSLRDVANMINPDALEQQANAPVERYHVDIERLKHVVAVPATRDTVGRFLEDVQAGRVAVKTSGARS